MRQPRDNMFHAFLFDALEHSIELDRERHNDATARSSALALGAVNLLLYIAGGDVVVITVVHLSKGLGGGGGFLIAAYSPWHGVAVNVFLAGTKAMLVVLWIAKEHIEIVLIFCCRTSTRAT
jgi:hypothetical protein